ncbi:MAG: phosphoribosylaminoimidazolesuccinocarboxamide synthase [Candidatus Natronoplasma sp.]
MKKLVRKGEVKEVFQISQEELEFHFSDNIFVFDKLLPDEIPRKGESLCKTSAYWFEKTEELGFKTHFIKIKEDEEDKMRVKNLGSIDDHEEIDEETTGYRIPLEFISRHYMAGSLYERFKKGEIDLEGLGFREEPEYGDRLPEPLLEVRTKIQDDSRVVDREEAQSIAGLTENEFDRIEEMVFEIDEMIKENAENNGLIHIDSGKEFAMTEDREPMVIDSFGNVDEDRFWSKESYEEGDPVRANKELIRQHYMENGYYDDLMKSRENNDDEPPVPSLSEEMLDRTSKTYVDLMFRLTNGTYGDNI